VLRFIAVMSLIVCSSVSAQDQTSQRSGRPIVENMKREPLVPSYCLYEDKKYSEGAVKTVDGQVMICMQRDSMSISFDANGREERDLIWESGNSMRGKRKIKAASAK
jgi:hypothetical protein